MKHRSPEQSSFTREKKFVAILAAAGALGSAALTSCSIEAQDVKLKPAETSTSVDSGRTYDSDIDTVRIENTVVNGSEYTAEERFYADPDKYEEFDQFLRAADWAPYFYEAFDDSYKSILADPNHEWTPEEREVFYKPDLNKPRSEWTNQDYLNYWTIAIFYATGLDDGPEVAQRAISVVARPGSNTHDRLQTFTEDYPGYGDIDIYRALPSPFSNEELESIDTEKVSIDERGGRFIKHESLRDGKIGYSVFANRGDQEHTIAVNDLTVGSLSDPDIYPILSQNR
tara:strand:+ start:12059 stop:12913 length:855 start_codon:yes stop_codon:yes gene_type:complete